MLGKLRRGRPSPAVVIALLALIVATSGVAVAAIPDDDGTVTACLSPGGTVKVIDAEAGETCPRKHEAVRLASTDAAGKVADADKLDGKDSTSFVESRWILVRGDGTRVDGTPGSRVVRQDEGVYSIGFGGSHIECGYTSTIGDVAGEVGPPGLIQNFQGSVSDVIVFTYDADGTPSDRDFYTTATC